MKIKSELSFGGELDPDQITSYIARCAQLAMVLEVSASPKPGNIDRCHDFEDTRYEHFLASATGVYPVIEVAAENRNCVGTLIRQAVHESTLWQKGGNTHFGAFLLLIPLSMAAGEILGQEGATVNDLISRAHSIVKSTDNNDAIQFYRTFSCAGVNVTDVEEFDLQDRRSIDSLKERGVSLYDLMEISKGYDQIAREWTTGFTTCAYCGKLITHLMEQDNVHNGGGLDINDAVVYAFLKLLSECPDTFIQTKYDKYVSQKVSKQAQIVLNDIEKGGFNIDAAIPEIQLFDEKLIRERINPGSTADIIIAGLFIALLGGLRF
ncbi:MAG: triphosphoribosyl-dephospho-CoA synthase [Methanosarcinaceae archaeon]|nr:triphosphoribosyl-dephospho-CoA synthase [Methanosarcinaceae archaeon]